MKWTPEVQRHLLNYLLTSSPATSKPDNAQIATYLATKTGQDCTPKAVKEYLARLRKELDAVEASPPATSRKGTKPNSSRTAKRTADSTEDGNEDGNTDSNDETPSPSKKSKRTASPRGGKRPESAKGAKGTSADADADDEDTDGAGFEGTGEGLLRSVKVEVEGDEEA